MRISERLLTVLVLCLLVAAVPAFARGNGERELNEARALVDGKRYAQAMSLIVEIMEKFPDLREETDRLVARVMEVRRQFNEKYGDLLVILRKDDVTERDVDRGLAIVEELKKLDPNPDPAVTQALAIAVRALTERGKYKLFLVVMQDAAAQIAGGKYPEAIATYLGGFIVARDDFDRAGLPALLHDSAVAVVGRLEETARQAASELPELQNLAATLATLLASPVTDTGRERFLAGLQPLSRTRGREAELRARALEVRGVKEAIDAARGSAGSSELWLPFIEWYVLGRQGSTGEGIAWAVRQPWVAAARQMSDAAIDAADEAFTAAEGAFAESVALAQFRALAVEARSRGTLALDLIVVETPAWQEAEGLVLSQDAGARAASLATNAGQIRQRIADAQSMESYAVAELAALEAAAGLERSLAAVPSVHGSSLAQMRVGRRSLAAIDESGVRYADDWRNRADAAAALPVMAGRASAVRERFLKAVAGGRAADTTLAVEIARLEAGGFEAERAAVQARLSRGRSLAAGTAEGQITTGKRPDLAGEEYVSALTEIGALLSGIDAWQGRWTSEPAHVTSSDGIVRLLAAQAEFRNRVVELQNEIALSATAAKTAADRATQLRGQGDSAFQAGQAEEKQQTYSAALRSYTTARDSYRDSLAWQENAAARTRLTELAGIIDRIAARAREQDLAEAQTLFNQGLGEYADSSYQAAITTLETAQDLWVAVTGDRNVQIDVYIERAKGALLVTGKLEITRTDPIYEDIRGFMVQAELSQTRAASLLKSGSRGTEYQGAIATARSSVDAILAVVPEYREARLLSLKIDELELGDAQFAKELLRRIATALADAKSSNVVPVTNAFYNLVAYTKLDRWNAIVPRSTRSDVSTAISALEVRLGLKEPPISQEDLQRSATAYRNANTEYRKNVNAPIQWEVALRLLQESIARNPTNRDAQKLQNEIVLKRRTGADVLSSEDLTKYRAAQTDFLNGLTGRARSVVDELLRKYPRNPLLKDLASQIQGGG